MAVELVLLEVAVFPLEGTKAVKAARRVGEFPGQKKEPEDLEFDPGSMTQHLVLKQP